MPGILPDTDSYLFYLFLLFCLCFVLQMIFYWVSSAGCTSYREAIPARQEPGVSVIICAHNEYLNLQEKLP